MNIEAMKYTALTILGGEEEEAPAPKKSPPPPALQKGGEKMLKHCALLLFSHKIQKGTRN